MVQVELFPTGSSNRDGKQTITQELQQMSERLDQLQLQLNGQREKCQTRVEQRYLEQIGKDIKKQSVAMHRLRDSVDCTTGMLRRSIDAQRRPPQEQAAPTNNLNDFLFRTISGPFDGQRRLLQKKNKMNKVSRPKVTRMPSRHGQTTSSTERSRSSSPSSSEFSQTASSSEAESASSNTDDEIHQEAASTPKVATSAPTVPQTISPASSSHCSPSCPASPSAVSSPRISIQDWSILIPPEGVISCPPPLPRKSSRRSAYTPRVPSIKRSASVKRKPSMRRKPVPAMPSMPSTPPPDAPSTNPMDRAGTRSSVATIASTDSAQDIMAMLEKRFSVTMMTPPQTPKFELGPVFERKALARVSTLPPKYVLEE